MKPFLFLLALLFSLPSFAADASADVDPCDEIELTFDASSDQIYVSSDEDCPEGEVEALTGFLKDSHEGDEGSPCPEQESAEGETTEWDEEQPAHCEDGDEEDCEHEIFRPDLL